MLGLFILRSFELGKYEFTYWKRLKVTLPPSFTAHKDALRMSERKKYANAELEGLCVFSPEKFYLGRRRKNLETSLETEEGFSCKANFYSYPIDLRCTAEKDSGKFIAAEYFASFIRSLIWFREKWL